MTTSFVHVKRHEPFRIPVQVIQQRDVGVEAKKVIKVVTVKDEEKVICSGELGEVEYC